VELPYTPSSFWEKPSEKALRYSSLLQRIASALRRDLWKWHGKDEGERAYRSWGGTILEVFDEFSASSTWRQLGVIPVISPVDSPDVILPHDDAPPVAWLTQMLEPWFAGSAYLNAAGVAALLEGLGANRDPVRKRGVRALRKYASMCRKIAPLRLKELAAIKRLQGSIRLREERPE